LTAIKRQVRPLSTNPSLSSQTNVGEEVGESEMLGVAEGKGVLGDALGESEVLGESLGDNDRLGEVLGEKVVGEADGKGVLGEVVGIDEGVLVGALVKVGYGVSG
jgi:hypothetical protein